MWTDEQIKELAEKHGWYAVDAWWQQSIPRFRAMLEEYAAQPGVDADLLPCGHSRDNLGGDFVGNSFCVACRDGQNRLR